MCYSNLFHYEVFSVIAYLVNIKQSCIQKPVLSAPPFKNGYPFTWPCINGYPFGSLSHLRRPFQKRMFFDNFPHAFFVEFWNFLNIYFIFINLLRCDAFNQRLSIYAYPLISACRSLSTRLYIFNFCKPKVIFLALENAF